MGFQTERKAENEEFHWQNFQDVCLCAHYVWKRTWAPLHSPRVGMQEFQIQVLPIARCKYKVVDYEKVLSPRRVGTLENATELEVSYTVTPL